MRWASIFFCVGLLSCGPDQSLNDEAAEPDARATADTEQPGDDLISPGEVAADPLATVPFSKPAHTLPWLPPEGPMPAIACEEGALVIPQTVLHLNGQGSSSEDGEIVGWEWSVDQPVGSVSRFWPSATVPDPTFEANVAGLYRFQLHVFDEQQNASMIPADFEVEVVPDEAIHVELLWNTPEDPDQSDEGPNTGSDVDLHFAHPWAGGPDLDGDGEEDGWFDQPFDCFWFNAQPNWGEMEPYVDDDPGLDRDDVDGAGPENINLNIPENTIYRVGVHYWNDHDFGPSFATVRIYIDGVLEKEFLSVMLLDCDMWEVCTIAWPSGEITPTVDDYGQLKITPQYHNPFFFQD